MTSAVFLISMGKGLREANWKDRLLYFLGRLRAFSVEGDSMLPTLKSGDTVLIDPNTKIEVGDIVLADHPYKSSIRVLKRVAEIEPSGDLILVGDNAAESTDSRTFGAVSIESIIGRVICRL